jgi:serine/threonine protein kinase
MSLEPGARIGDYEVLSVLGAGGMGQVYKVRNVISDRLEAMKVLLPNLTENAELAERFLREIKVQAAMKHPNIATLHTALRVDNQLLMVMEYVEGHTIDSYMQQGRIPIQHAIGYMVQVLSALAYAHKMGVVHRDIKPANMMITPQGVVKLMDFGIALLAQDRKLTQAGQNVGSLYYMSPEQINGAPNVDGRSDLYSLGVSLYQMLTGKRPFDGDSDFKIMAAHLQTTPVPPIEIDPQLPAVLNEVIMLAIARDPDKRFQSADAMLAALNSVHNQPQAAAAAVVQARPQPTAKPATGNKRGLYMMIGSVATVAVLVVAAMQIPKFFGTKAGESQATTQPPAITGQQPVKSPDLTPPPAQEPAASTTTPQQTNPPATKQTLQPNPPPMRQPQQQVSQREPERPVIVPPVVHPENNPPPAVQQPPAQQPVPQPNAEEAVKRQRLIKLQSNRLTQMEARVGAVQGSLKRLQEQQARSGLGLRGDMAAASQRLELQLNSASKSINEGDSAAAASHLDLAERALEMLEKFLGL